METDNQKSSMSKKTSIAMFTLMALTNAEKMNLETIIGITVISVTAILVQGIIDWKKK